MDFWSADPDREYYDRGLRHNTSRESYHDQNRVIHDLSASSARPGNNPNLVSSVARYFGPAVHDELPSTSVFDPRKITPYRTRVNTHRRSIRPAAAAIASNLKPVKVCFYKDCSLPAQLTDGNIILDTQIDFSIEDTEIAIKCRLRDNINLVPEYADVKPTDLHFLSCERKRLNKPLVVNGYQWTGKRVKCLMGQGRLYIQVAKVESDQEYDSDLPVIMPSTLRQDRATIAPVNPVNQRWLDLTQPVQTQHDRTILAPVQQPCHELTQPVQTRHDRTILAPVQQPGREVIQPVQTRQPWLGNTDNMIDRLDVRANLRHIPEVSETEPPKHDRTILAPVQQPGRELTQPVQTRDITSQLPRTQFNFTDFVPMHFIDDDDRALQEALKRSMEGEQEDSQETGHCTSVDSCLRKEEVAGILRAHSEAVVSGTQRCLHICRTAIWKTALPYFARSSFDKKAGVLNITFSSDEEEEDAEDCGGPRREFFRLLLRAIVQESGTLLESDVGYYPRLNIDALTKKTHRSVGLMLATMICQGGEAPTVFSPCVVDYLINGTMDNVSVDDIPDCNIRSTLNSVVDATTEVELSTALEGCDWRLNVDGLANNVQMLNRDAFVHKACLYFTIICRQAALDQLANGLQYYKVLDIIQDKPALRCLLEYSDSQPDAGMIISLIRPIYSIAGSMKRTKEEVVITKFRAFVTDVQDGELMDTLDQESLSPDEKTFISSLKPSHILAFITGSSKEPAAGFEVRPKIVFLHDSKTIYPMSQTCSCQLTLVVNEKTTADSPQFAHALITSLMNGATFSTI